MSRLKVLAILIATAITFSISSAQAQWTYPAIMSTGDTVNFVFPPADSLYLHDQLILRFKKGFLNNDSLCFDCNVLLGAGGGKRHRTADATFDLYNECRSMVMEQQFTTSIILDPVVRMVLNNAGATHLTRISWANPCTDTASITRRGDTIPMDPFNCMLVHFNNDTSVIPVLTTLGALLPASLKYASPDFLYKLTSSTPTDPEFTSGRQESLNMIGMPLAWDYSVGSPRIKVAVVDDGLDFERCELGGAIGPGNKVIGGWDYLANTIDDLVTQSPHGTSVASIIGAFTNRDLCGVTAGKGYGMAGIAGGWGPFVDRKGTTLIGFGCAMPDGFQPSSWLKSAIEDAAQQTYHIHHYGYGAHIINNSWGDQGPLYNPSHDPAVREAAAEAFRNDVVFVCAKGNSGATNPTVPYYPADFDPPKDFIAVGGTAHNRLRIGYSNHGNMTDLVAPAGSTAEGNDQIVRAQLEHTESWRWFDGTSAATPHVSGVVALMMDHFPRLSGTEPYVEDWEGMLVAACDDIVTVTPPLDQDPDGTNYPDGYDTRTGWGFLRADNALDMISPRGKRYDVFHFNVPIEQCEVESEWGPWQKITLADMNHPGSISPGIWKARRKRVLGTAEYSTEINTSLPVYVWGVSGTLGGWSSANPNIQERWSRVVSGLPDDMAREGMRHEFSRVVTAESYVYEIELSPGNTVIMPPTESQGVSFTVFGTKGVAAVGHELSSKPSFKIWPTLPNTSLHVQLLPYARSGYLDINDITGRVVFSKKILSTDSQLDIPTASFANGLYIVRHQSDLGSHSIKIIVQH